VKKNKKILVLLGGRSRERTISFQSGNACYSAIKKIGYDVSKYDPVKNISSNIKKFKPDLVYVHWVTPQAIIALLLKKIFRVKYVFSTHSNDAIILKKLPGGIALLN